MMAPYFLKRIWRGQTLARILMDKAFSHYTLRGTVVDVGGGRRPDYFNYFKKDESLGAVSIKPIDGSISNINFEKDALPFPDGTADTVICANVLEHIYHHDFLTSEMCRILKPGGQLYGFVPFLVNYHPDPHDYFRYTKESLPLILSEAGFGDISVAGVGGGPFFVNFNNIILSMPRLCRVILFPFYALLDKVFLKLRPAAAARYPLGYIFSAKK